MDERSDYFAGLGFLVRKGFLDGELCARMRAEALAAHMAAATLVKERDAWVVDERTRRAKTARVSRETRALVDSRLDALAPVIQQHFHVPITGHESAQFLVYRRGDFFRPHQDSSAHRRLPDDIRRRRVSVVLFLNSQLPRPAPDAYCGGALTFFRLTPDPDWDTCRAGLVGEEGLLVAFRADLIHEVQPVTHGQRFTVVSWFTGGVEGAGDADAPP